MLKAKAGQNVLLGLDKENIRRLQEGKPICVKAGSLEIDVDIYIVYGDTLEDIAKQHNLPTVQ